MKNFTLAVLGATGLVGQTMISILEEKNLPIDNIYFFASERSEGKKIEFKGKTYTIEALSVENLKNKKIDFALSALDSDFSKEFSPILAKMGTTVIDNSSAFRMEKEIPLIVPEVNPDVAFTNKGIISNPNCSTIQSVVAIKPIYDKYGIKRIIYNTYQSVSGSGVNGLKDLEEGLKGGKNEFYPHQIAYNTIPHIDSFLDTGYTKEEMKMVDETRKILGDESIKITATAVRVPAKYSHSVSINIETKEPFEIEDVIKLYENFPGIILQNNSENNVYPTNLHAEGKDEVFVGRIRRDFSTENGINLWCTADNTRKGAALNTIQILELLVK